jgi:hypothetical protein
MCSDIHNTTDCWDAIPTLTKRKSRGNMLYGNCDEIAMFTRSLTVVSVNSKSK